MDCRETYEERRVSIAMQIIFIFLYLHIPSYVLFNRQPSLHKMSMMSHRVRLMPYSSECNYMVVAFSVLTVLSA